jgi:hypothetical protein
LIVCIPLLQISQLSLRKRKIHSLPLCFLFLTLIVLPRLRSLNFLYPLIPLFY